MLSAVCVCVTTRPATRPQHPLWQDGCKASRALRVFLHTLPAGRQPRHTLCKCRQERSILWYAVLYFNAIAILGYDHNQVGDGGDVLDVPLHNGGSRVSQITTHSPPTHTHTLSLTRHHRTQTHITTCHIILSSGRHLASLSSSSFLSLAKIHCQRCNNYLPRHRYRKSTSCPHNATNTCILLPKLTQQ